MLKLAFSVFFISLIFENAFSKEIAYTNVSAQLGMANISFVENASTLKNETGDIKEQASGSVAAISLKATYDYIVSPKRAYFAQVVAPFTGSNGLFLGGGGINFFFNDLSSMFDLSNEGSTITIQPKKRFYWGLMSGIGYLIYQTETAKKSDVGLLLGGQLGAMYNIKPNLDLKAEFGVGRLIGISTTSMAMQVFFGLSYYLDFYKTN
jgi:hypothetical protein